MSIARCLSLSPEAREMRSVLYLSTPRVADGLVIPKTYEACIVNNSVFLLGTLAILIWAEMTTTQVHLRSAPYTSIVLLLGTLAILIWAEMTTTQVHLRSAPYTSIVLLLGTLAILIWAEMTTTQVHLRSAPYTSIVLLLGTLAILI
ncbi:hypothetical protein J6590_008981 [Homalodisca vitripennis]|nr:hypothetical protein J6590_008981 [Homalodisca vitripennis]